MNPKPVIGNTLFFGDTPHSCKSTSDQPGPAAIAAAGMTIGKVAGREQD